MRNPMKIGILACMLILSNAQISWGFVSSGGNCDDSCKKEEEAKFLAAVFGGMIAIAVVAGVVYWIVEDDDKQNEFVNNLNSQNGNRLRIVPVQDTSDRHDLNLEYRLSDYSMIGVHVGYGSKDSGLSNWEEEPDYVGGAFYRLSF